MEGSGGWATSGELVGVRSTSSAVDGGGGRATKVATFGGRDASKMRDSSAGLSSRRGAASRASGREDLAGLVLGEAVFCSDRFEPGFDPALSVPLELDIDEAETCLDPS
jgi:hypothetical protein